MQTAHLACADAALAAVPAFCCSLSLSPVNSFGGFPTLPVFSLNVPVHWKLSTSAHNPKHGQSCAL